MLPIILSEYWESPLVCILNKKRSPTFPESGERTLFIGRDNPIRISTGHRLLHHDGKCSRPHGHNYEISVEVTGSLTQDGWVVDKGDITSVIDDWDHRFLLEKDDPSSTPSSRAATVIHSSFSNTHRPRK